MRANNFNTSPVDYSKLTITSPTPVHCDELVDYLFDEKETGVASGFGTSKWNA